MKWMTFFVSAGGEQKPGLVGEIVSEGWSFNPPWWLLSIVVLLVVVRFIYASQRQ